VETKVQSSRLQLKFQGLNAYKKNKVNLKDQQENRTNIGNQNYKRSNRTYHLPNK
jgi:hypothetical protein